MDKIIINSNEYVYPDVFEYESASHDIRLHTPRGSYATVQILLTGVPNEAPIEIGLTKDFENRLCEQYELVPVYVEKNGSHFPDEPINRCPNRVAPFYIYDCMKPLGDRLDPKDGTAGLYICFPVGRDEAPGVYTGEVMIQCGEDRFAIPISMQIYKAVVPLEESLKMINGYRSSSTAEYFNVKKGSAEHKRLDTEHLLMLRRMRQNMVYVGGAETDMNPDGSYQFDFSDLEKQVETHLAMGFRYFMLPSIGRRKSWSESTILIGPGLPATGYEAYLYLSAYLPALRRFLNEKGWIPYCFMGISDEPNRANATEYRVLSGIVRKFFPEIRLADALSYVPIFGALDVWIPLNSSYDMYQKEFESFRVGDDEIWFYVCCSPKGNGYINRFMDYPLLATRYLFWGNYKYNLTGYLHWAANAYQPGQDPFTQNAPLHRNTDMETILPPGDTHIIYPGKEHPWMSIRLEAHRQSAEDYELFKVLEKHDKQKADALCSRCFTSFNEVVFDIATFEETRMMLLEAVSALDKN